MQQLATADAERVSVLRKGLKPLLVAAALAAWVMFDASRAPADQWTGKAAVLAIHAYQRIGSPMVTRAGFRCRFTPSCSHYGEQAIEKYGIAQGSWLTARRIARCRPGTPMGTIDNP